MAKEAVKTYKVVKDKLNNKVHIVWLLGRERVEKLKAGEVVEVTKAELDLLKLNSLVKLNGGKNGS